MTQLFYKDIEIYQTPEEIQVLRDIVKNVEDVPGEVAEIGVYNGASATILAEETRKQLYLFDTFTGFPDTISKYDPVHFKKGDCATTLVADSIVKNAYVGVFPSETGNVIKDKVFAFVHIDVDIYQSTKDSLEFFRDKMSSGGAILVHDYPAHSGVKKAVDEFLVVNPWKFEVKGGRQIILWKE